MKIICNLQFSGDCREAFERYAEILGGEIRAMICFGEVPGEEKRGPALKDKIMHAWLNVGDQSLMGGDSPTGKADARPGGPTAAVHTEDLSEARRIYDGLLDGGTASMPFGPTPWSPGFGMLTDRFGTPWIVNTTPSLRAAIARPEGFAPSGR